MKRVIRVLTVLGSLCLPIIGCSSPPETAMSSATSVPAYQQEDLSTLTYRAVDLILASAPDVTQTTPLVVTSLSDTKKLDTASPLGNIIADMIRTRLSQTGHRTAEVRLRNAISLRRGEGEFMLSRTRSELPSAPSVAAVLTGTYATSYEKVYVSIKLISVSDGHIVTGTDFVLPIRDVLGLVQEPNT